MDNEFIVAYNPARHQCEVCGDTITYPYSLKIKELGYAACGNFSCKQVMSKKASLAPALFEAHLSFNKKLLQQRRRNDKLRKQHIDSTTAKEQQEHQGILRLVLQQKPELSQKNLNLLVLASGGSALSAPSDERLEKYTEHIKMIMAEAGEYPDASEVIYDEHHDAYGKRNIVDQRFDENPDLHAVSDKLCSMCRGGCCASGGEHAYLSVFSMRRYMDDNPEYSITEIMDFYISRISNQTIENSCINQTATGCALPRELRSDICNGYYCEPVKSFQKKMADNDEKYTILAIQRSSTYWNRFELGVYNEISNVALIEKNNGEDPVHIPYTLPLQTDGSKADVKD